MMKLPTAGAGSSSCRGQNTAWTAGIGSLSVDVPSSCLPMIRPPVGIPPDGTRRGGLAASGLRHDAERLPLLDVERDPVRPSGHGLPPQHRTASYRERTRAGPRPLQHRQGVGDRSRSGGACPVLSHHPATAERLPAVRCRSVPLVRQHSELWPVLTVVSGGGDMALRNGHRAARRRTDNPGVRRSRSAARRNCVQAIDAFVDFPEPPRAGPLCRDAPAD